MATLGKKSSSCLFVLDFKPRAVLGGWEHLGGRSPGKALEFGAAFAWGLWGVRAFMSASSRLLQEHILRQRAK